MKQNIFLLCLCTSIGWISGCENKKDEVAVEPPPVQMPAETPPPSVPAPRADFPPPEMDGEQVSYQIVNEFVFAPKCLTCHSTAAGIQGNVNLEDYDQLYARIADVRAAVATGRMPLAPGPALTQAEKDLVLKWIDAGASEIAIVPVTEPPVPGDGAPADNEGTTEAEDGEDTTSPHPLTTVHE